MEKYYITTPIYYVNAAPHIGHAYTTIAADILASYWRMKLGDEHVYFLTGTDEHGEKIYQKAVDQGITPEEFTKSVADTFKNVWEKLEISHNQFIRTSDKEHVQFVQSFMQKLHNEGVLYQDEYEGRYCVGCEKFLTDKDLEGGVCRDHRTEPQLLKEKNWFFKLSDYVDNIKELIEKDILHILPSRSKSEVLGLLEQGLPDFPITRSKEKVQWGIEVPWDESQLFYVWADALTNYISTEKPQEFWPANIQILGKDILKFHAIYWIAMLMAGGYELPSLLFGHGFFTINGEKMSKTIGNVIDPVEMVNEYGIDATKYLLMIQFPFGQDGDIERDKFTEHYNAYLANGLGNLFNRVITLVEKNYDGIVPASVTEHRLKDQTEKAWQEYIQALESDIQLHTCLMIINNLITECDQHISSTELWKVIKDNPDDGATEISVLLEVLRNIAWMIRPFMKHTSDIMLDQLGIGDSTHISINKACIWGGLSKGTQTRKGDILFERKQ